jgi:hypothetical protein
VSRYVSWQGASVWTQLRLICVKSHFPPRRGQLRSRIHENTISLRFLGIILRVLILEFPNTMFTNQFQNSFAQGWGLGGGGGGNPLVEVTVNSKEENP